jgi:hypothetical protein
MAFGRAWTIEHVILYTYIMQGGLPAPSSSSSTSAPLASFGSSEAQAPHSRLSNSAICRFELTAIVGAGIQELALVGGQLQ